MNLLLIISVLFFSSISFSSGSKLSNHNHGHAKGRTSTSTTTQKPPSVPHRSNRTRIIGGIETSRNEYPFIVSLFRGSQGAGHFCGGSIISREWVITAAHCVNRMDFRLTAGEHDLRIYEGTEQIVTAVKVIRHPTYNPVTFEDDIALVKVAPLFNYTDFVKSFQLPNFHFVATGNVTTAGWGVLEEGSAEVSPVLRKVTIDVFPNMECSKTYGKDFHVHKMICAGKTLGGMDACQGDSGGPLLCDDTRFGDTLCGIVSYGFGCARADFAGVYTKVSHYAEWIYWEQEMDKNPNAFWTTPKQNLSSVTEMTTTHRSTPAEEIRTTRRRRRWWDRRSSATQHSRHNLLLLGILILTLVVSNL